MLTIVNNDPVNWDWIKNVSVEKYNRNHDELGQFSSGEGGVSGRAKNAMSEITRLTGVKLSPVTVDDTPNRGSIGTYSPKSKTLSLSLTAPDGDTRDSYMESEVATALHEVSHHLDYDLGDGTSARSDLAVGRLTRASNKTPRDDAMRAFYVAATTSESGIGKVLRNVKTGRGFTSKATAKYVSSPTEVFARAMTQYADIKGDGMLGRRTSFGMDEERWDDREFSDKITPTLEAIFAVSVEKHHGADGRFTSGTDSEVEKYNRNHDAKGRFSSGTGGASVTGPDVSYRGQHSAPTNDGFAQNLGNAVGTMYPADVTGPNGVHYYGSGDPSLRADEARAISIMARAVRGHELGRTGGQVTVYRAVPKDAPRGGINPGDWVTPSRKYAAMHGTSNLNGKFKIREAIVPADHLYTDANSLLEWGYDPNPAEAVTKGEIQKYNRNHDARGRFATTAGAAFSVDTSGYSERGAPHPLLTSDAMETTKAAEGAIRSAVGFTLPVKVKYVSQDHMRQLVRSEGTVGFYQPDARGTITMADSSLANFFLAHEYAHLLDFEHFGTGSKAASGNGATGKLSGVMTAIRSTAEYGDWGRGANPAYWASNREVFARAFAQYVSEKSGDKSMLAGLASQGSAQWPLGSFSDISAQFDTLFKVKG